MERYIFISVFSFFLISLYDRFFSRRQPRGWFVRWRENVTLSLCCLLVSLFFSIPSC